eukprot:g8479.t1
MDMEGGTSGGDPGDDKIMLGFQSLSISCVDPPEHIVANVSGFVVKGGITAVLGPSSSGKSVLMKVLTGRLPTLSVAGEITYCGERIDPHSQANGFGFVPQEDSLIGDLTVRETFEVAARLRNVGTLQETRDDAEEVIQGLGLGKVGDNVVGTVLKRGLSGGEKRRTTVGQELVVKQSLALLDEPTSGLDGTAAYDVIKVTDVSFDLPIMGQINFTQVYATSDTHAQMIHDLETSKAKMLVRLTNGVVPQKFERPGFLRQLSTLLRRDAVVAVRDPTLYHLQFVLHVLYGFFVGITFWNIPTNLDDRQTQLAAACMWIIMLQSYVHVFKVFYLVNSNRRFTNERANLSYGVTAFFLAETIVTCLAQLLWVPGCSLAFFMIGLPKEAYLFSMVALYAGALAAEGMINLVTKLTDNPSIAIVISQAALVILTVFAGGIFIPFDEIPEYWSWVEVSSVYKHCSKAFLMAVFEQVTYDCPTGSVTLTTPEDTSVNDGWCTTFQHTYACDEGFDDNTLFCEVEGTTVLDMNAGGLSGDKWTFLGHIVALIVVFRAGVFFFLKFPKEFISHAIKSRLASPLVRTSLEHQSEIQMLWGEIVKLKKAASQGLAHPVQEDVKSGSISPKLQRGETVMSLTAEGGGIAPESPEIGADVPQEKALVFRDISLKLPSSGKMLIETVTAKATGGRVLALMGPSGAGKTSLLNALGGRATYGQVSGFVTLGGRPLTSQDLNYVPQFDDHNERFTPRELLTYMKHLQIGANTKTGSKSVIELLHILGLSLKADERLGTLSGGEQKRLSIGVGMVSEPEVLFLDEPTTGLDSASAYSVVKYISNLAKQTKVVCIMTIHQPASEVFDMIEDLMLMEAGRLTYFGTTKNARCFFDSLAGQCPSGVNPADYYLDLISKPPHADVGKGSTWQELYYMSDFEVAIPNATALAGSGDGDDIDHDRPHWSYVAQTLLDNQLAYYWRATEVHWFRMLELVVLAIFVGTMYFRLDNDRIAETAAAAFFNMWCALFAVVASVPAFARDRRQTLQEMLNGAYGPAMYCCTQFLASAPFTLVSALVYQSIFHWLVGFNDSFSAYLYAVLLTACLLFMMEAIMLMVVETLKNAMLCCTFSIVVLGVLFLFAGFFIKPADMVWGIRWITYFIPTRYAFDGYLRGMFQGQSYSTPFGMISGEHILQSEFGQSSGGNHWIDLLIVTGWVLVLRIGHFCVIFNGVQPYRKAMSVLTV